jgi:hypothetical protein
MFEKGRRPWKRGPKMRYSVYKAEDRAEGDVDYEEWSRRIAEAKGYNLEDFMAHDVRPSLMWRETYDRLHNYWLDHGGEEFRVFNEQG